MLFLEKLVTLLATKLFCTIVIIKYLLFQWFGVSNRPNILGHWLRKVASKAGNNKDTGAFHLS
jgi:hypothetical protein